MGESNRFLEVRLGQFDVPLFQPQFGSEPKVLRPEIELCWLLVYCFIDRLYRLADVAAEHLGLRKPVEINAYRVPVLSREHLRHTLANQFDTLVRIPELRMS